MLVALHLPSALQTVSVGCHTCGQTSAQECCCLALLTAVDLRRAWCWPGRLGLLEKLSPTCSSPQVKCVCVSVKFRDPLKIERIKVPGEN